MVASHISVFTPFYAIRWISSCAKLHILDLTGNIGSLPEHPAFSSMPNLQELYLRRM